MNFRMRLACCALLASCGTLPAGSDAVAPPGETPCTAAAAGTGHPAALLRIGCDGGVVPGRASWSREGNAVTLEIAAGTHGPAGAELVSKWPPLEQPPWLAHQVESITVLSRDRIRVRFRAPGGPGGPGGEPLDEPERIFADPRLSGLALAMAEGDARDAIDAGPNGLLTRHDASVEYARAVGRTVRLVAFDRRYVVAFARDAETRPTVDLGSEIGADWSAWGAPGARRAASVDWTEIDERCGAGGVGVGVVQGRAEGAAADRAFVAESASGEASEHPAVSYPQGDGAARQIAERVVSLAMRTDARGTLVRALTGSASRLAVRAAAPGSGRGAADVAAVVAVPAGPGHPCSHHAEALRTLADWEPLRGAGRTNVVLVGEAALFEISGPAPWDG